MPCNQLESKNAFCRHLQGTATARVNMWAIEDDSCTTKCVVGSGNATVNMRGPNRVIAGDWASFVFSAENTDQAVGWCLGGALAQHACRGVCAHVFVKPWGIFGAEAKACVPPTRPHDSSPRCRIHGRATWCST